MNPYIKNNIDPTKLIILNFVPVNIYDIITNILAVKPIDSLNSIEELKDELQKVDAMISQTRSRFTTIRKKLKPLIAWKKVAQSKIEELSNK